MITAETQMMAVSIRSGYQLPDELVLDERLLRLREFLVTRRRRSTEMAAVVVLLMMTETDCRKGIN